MTSIKVIGLDFGVDAEDASAAVFVEG